MNANVSASVTPVKKTNFRWIVALMLWFAGAILYMDRTNLSATAPMIMREFNISAAEMGVIMSAFFWPYALCQIPGGWLADKFGQRKAYASAVVSYSLATAATALGQGFYSFITCRALLGVGEAGAFPNNPGVTARWFPDKERARATAIFDCGGKAGSAFAMPFLVWLMVLWGWQAPFIICGILGFVWAGFWLKFYNDPEKSKYINQAELDYIRQGQAKKEGIGERAPLKWYQVMRYRNIQAMCIGLFALNYLFYFFITWFPTYLLTERGISLSSMGWLAMIPALSGMIIQPFAGYFCDWMYMRGVSLTKARKVNLVLGMLLATSVAFCGYVESSTGLLVLLSLSYMGLATAQTAAWSLPADVAPQGMASLVGGWQNAIGNLGGAVGPIITGYIVATTHSFQMALVVSGVITLIGALTYLIYLGKVEPIVVESDAKLSECLQK